jgi:hypothetical protein
LSHPPTSGTSPSTVEIDLRRARDVGIQAARAAGDLLRRRVDSVREVRHKSAIDIVTDVDLESERRCCMPRWRAYLPAAK